MMRLQPNDKEEAMGDMQDNIQGMKDKAEAKASEMKVDAEARMQQMREQNAQHSANEE